MSETDDKGKGLEQGILGHRTAVDAFALAHHGIFDGPQQGKLNYSKLKKEEVLNDYFSRIRQSQILYLTPTFGISVLGQGLPHFYKISRQALADAVYNRQSKHNVTALLTKKTQKKFLDNMGIAMTEDDQRAVGIVLQEINGKHFIGSWSVVVDGFTKSSKDRILRIKDLLMEYYRNHSDHFLGEPDLFCIYPKSKLLSPDDQRFLSEKGLSSDVLNFSLEDVEAKLQSGYNERFRDLRRNRELRRQAIDQIPLPPPRPQGAASPAEAQGEQIIQAQEGVSRNEEMNKKPVIATTQEVQIEESGTVPQEGEPEVVLPDLDEIARERERKERKLLARFYGIGGSTAEEDLAGRRGGGKGKRRRGKRRKSEQSEDEE